MDPVVFDYRYDYQRTFYPYSGNGLRNGRSASLFGIAQGALRREPAGEVEVVARLSIPGEDGTVQVALVGGALMRTVCRPDSKRACTVDEFLSAATSDAPWRDSPFRESRSYGTNDGEVGRPQGRAIEHYEAEAKRWDPPSHAKEVTEAAARSLSAYVAAGGLVYMPCEEPKLVLFSLLRGDGRTRRIEVGWRFPDFDAFSDPTKGRERDRSGHDPNYRQLKVDRVAMPDALASFRLDEEEGARALARAYASRSKDAAPELEPLVDYVDPAALREPDNVSKVLTAAREAVDPRHASYFRSVAAMTRETAIAFHDARDILASSEVPTPEAMGRALAALGDACTPHLGAYSTASWIALRWSTAVDRDLARALSVEVEDHEALAAMP